MTSHRGQGDSTEEREWHAVGGLLADAVVLETQLSSSQNIPDQLLKKRPGAREVPWTSTCHTSMGTHVRSLELMENWMW